MTAIILNVAIADAYAMGWEFLRDSDEKPVHDWTGYRSNPRIPQYIASKYSDDTMRLLINSRVILRHDPFRPLDYIREIKAECSADKRDGWSRGFRGFLESMMDRPDGDWLNALVRRNTNGAVMGASVCGFLSTPAEVIRAAKVQAEVTHDSEAAVYAAGCALALHGLRNGSATRAELHAYACSHEPQLRSLMPELPADPARSMLASDTYATALNFLSRCNDFRSILDLTVSHGGDTDSIASVAIAIASAGDGFDANYPKWAVSDLECGDSASRFRLIDVGSALSCLS